MDWTTEAQAELDNVPAFVRSMAKGGVEKHVRVQGKTRVDVDDVRAVKDKYFGMINNKTTAKTTKVAIVRCDIVSETCPGVGCLKAWHNRRINFEQYGPEAELIGFFTCGGCSGRRVHRLAKKLKENYELDVVHLASCMLFDDDYPKCPFKELIKKSIEAKDVQVVEGTHH
ncbi:MAG: CGGC domain-containing protein [Carboxydocellales bacterium]